MRIGELNKIRKLGGNKMEKSTSVIRPAKVSTAPGAKIVVPAGKVTRPKNGFKPAPKLK